MATSASKPPLSRDGLPTVAIFGGTFDPVHNGHLRIALELKQQLQLDDMRLLPSYCPPHRQAPGCSSDDRVAMVRLAIANCPELSVDCREIERGCAAAAVSANPSPSYMIDTLQQLRAELGEQVALILAVGMDSLVNLHTWHRWQELTDYAHLLVAARPGWEVPATGPVAEFLRDRLCADASELRCVSAGRVLVQTLSLLPISATDIRRQISRDMSPAFLMPDAVWAYIQQHQLYQS